MPNLEAESAWVKTISLAPPSLKNNIADAGRLLGALKAKLDTGAVRSNPAFLP